MPAPTRGDVQTDTFFVIDENPDKTIAGPDFAVSEVKDCPFILPLFGDIADIDNFKNDRTGFFRAYDPNIITSVDIVLQKCVNDVFVDVVTFIDNKYGTFSSLGTFQADGLDYTSMYMDWRQVLIDPDGLGTLGEGKYRLKTIEVNTLASVDDQNQFSFRYKLQNFSAERANGTILFETNTSRILGDHTDQKKTVTFPPGWLDAIRLFGWFGENTSEYEEERIRLEDGELIDIQDDQIENYLFESDRIPALVHNYVKTRVNQANIIEVTDYNADNANCHIQTQVVRTGDYSPRWIKKSKLAGVKVEFKSAFDLLRKLNC